MSATEMNLVDARKMRGFGEMVCLTDCFGGARKYVSEGLPKDNVFYRGNNDAARRKWLDKGDYSSFPPAVRDAARFRDGLVMDRDVYPEFMTDFSNIWAMEYKKQSELHFRHLLSSVGPEPEEVTLCLAGAHTCSAAGLCDSASFQLRLMTFHLAFVEGYQSQSLIRDKVLMLLDDDIQSLPKNKPKTEPRPVCKYKFTHSLCVVLHTLARQKQWLKWKIYSPHDMDKLIDACRRCNTALSLLIKGGTFDDPHMYKVFINLVECVKILEELNDFVQGIMSVGRFFPVTALTIFEKHATVLQAKYGKWTPPNDDDDDEDKGDKGDNNDGKDAENQAPEHQNLVASASAPAAAAAASPDESLLGKRAGSSSAAAACGDDGGKAKHKRAKE